jgi:hypothetical protein
MSQFYDQASLVMIPSGYKNGKVYSQKPLSADGELTFTRASTATRVNASGLIEEVASGLPRLDYSGGASCPSLLLEPQRTNLVTYSEQFDNAAWSKVNATITANDAVSPDGYTNADKLVSTGGASRIEIFPTFADNTIYTASIFAKQGNVDYIMVNVRDKNNVQHNTYFDLSDGTKGSSNGSPISTSIEAVGDYYRVSITIDSSSGGTTPRVQYLIANTDNNVVTASGEYIHIYGAQLEAGSYATSYIPTTTAVTRLADSAYKTGISSLIGQTEGTLYWEGYVTPAGSYNSLMSVEQIGNYFFNIRLNTTNKIEASTSGFSNDFVIAASTEASANTYYKIAGAYKSGQSVLYVNGVQIGTTAVTFTVPSLSQFRFNVYNVFNEQKSTAQALIFKTRLTNAQLAELTTL